MSPRHQSTWTVSEVAYGTYLEETHLEEPACPHATETIHRLLQEHDPVSEVAYGAHLEETYLYEPACPHATETIHRLVQEHDLQYSATHASSVL